MRKKSIAVFGGSSPRPNEPAYLEAERLGQLLGQAGCTVLNGGYAGTMEAVSKGAAQAGGQVIGVTCAAIESWRGSKPNAYIQQEQRCETLGERLEFLINNCEAAIALPGGIGTLAEILFLWNHLVIQAVAPKPLVLVGPGWQTVIEAFHQSMEGYSPAAQWALVQFAPDVEAAARMVVQ